MATPATPGATPGADDTATRRVATAAPASSPHRIFISYARADAPVAHQVEQVLLQWGCQPWLDQRSLSGGQDWTAALEQAVDASQAMALILTPAALTSSMVRWEYERALARGLPVLLIRAARVGQLPSALAQAPLIDFRNTRRAGSALYCALADCGLAPSAPDDRLDAVVGFDIFTALEGRAPPDWTVYKVPLGYYRRRLLLAAVPLVAALALPLLAGPLLQPDRPGGGVFLLMTLVAALALVLISSRLFGGRWGIVRLLMALGRIQPEIVVRTPEACNVFALRSGRGMVVMPHRYLYAWVASARASANRWGGAWVEFTDRASGQVVSLRIPRGLPNHHAIAEAIAADVAAYQARQDEHLDVAAAPTTAAGESAASPASQIRYCLIAPRSTATVIASAQAWLRRRGVAPAEMVWDAEDGGLLLPTRRGAEQSRLALFADVPAVTQSPRCRAILADLRRDGTLLIPLRVTSAPPAPSEWSSTQWVDFSPAASRARSLLGLCDALDRAGIALSPASGGTDAFDAEIALARGVFERTPPGWSAFIADAGMEQALRRSHRRAGVVMALSILGILALLGVATVQAAQMESPSDPGYQYFIDGAITAAVILVLLSLPFWRLVAGQFRQARIHDDILRDRGAPEGLVVTPQGIAFHLIRRSRRAAMRRVGAPAPFDAPLNFMAGGFAFDELAAMTRRRTLMGAPLLRLETRAGEAVTLSLANLSARSDAAAEAAITAFTAAREPRSLDS